MSTTLPLADAVRDDSGTDAQVAVLAPRTSTSEKVLRIVIPIVTVLIVIAIWQAIIELYADDPDAAEPVAEARRNLQATPAAPAAAKTTTEAPSTSEPDSPPKAEQQ